MGFVDNTIELGPIVADHTNIFNHNLELFQDVDRFSLDLYGAVQDGYLQRRTQAIVD